MRDRHRIESRLGRCLFALALAAATAAPGHGPAAGPARPAGPLRDVGAIERLEGDPTPARRRQHAAPSAPALRDVPLGQRLRTEADCAGCHRIEDRHRPVPALDRFVMT